MSTADPGRETTRGVVRSTRQYPDATTSAGLANTGGNHMYVCICKAVTSQVIIELAERGIRRTRDIGAACGAGTDCAKCRPRIRALVDAAPPAERAADSEEN
jgi:bacterioferritin-associated ferredoxin